MNYSIFVFRIFVYLANLIIMKKITILLLIFITASAYAQDDYNKWSIELSGGLNKASRPYSESFYSPTFGPWSADAGLRYMINEKFGFKLNLGYANVEEGDNVVPFQTQYYHGTLQGVVNLGSLFKFRDWTQSFNLLGHGGAGIARMTTDEDAFLSDETDYMSVFTVGLTPQVKLGKSIALVGDLSIYGNVNQDFTWDGNTETVNRGFDGMLVNASIGLNIYLGNKEKHADWVDNSEETELRKKLDSVQNRLAKLETDLQDEDQDGVPNYLDREPNSMNGVAVDSKGVAVDQNNNGIPDEIESSLDERYTSKEEFKEGGANNSIGIKKLLNDGYVNVYFQFNSDKPETYSFEAINYLVKYMHENPNANADLVGYADEVGNAEYNRQLSERRAKRVYDIIIASGIDKSRLSYRGEGIDNSVDKDSSDARQLVRRVTFKLK